MDALSIVSISMDDRKWHSLLWSPSVPMINFNPSGDATIMSDLSKLVCNLNCFFFLLNDIPIRKSSSYNLSSSQNSFSYLSLLNTTEEWPIILLMISIASPLNGVRISILHLVNPLVSVILVKCWYMWLV